jgi:outer membrane protein
MNSRASLFALVTGLATALPLVAGETALTLGQCLEMATSSHPTLAAAQAAVEAAARAVDEAGAPQWPQVDLSAGYHRWQRRAFLPGGLFPAGVPAPELIGPLDDWNAGISARATLFDFGERRAGVEAAVARRDAVAADAETTWADLRLAVQRAFFALAAARELEQVAARNLERAEAGLRLAEARQRAGAVPTADVLRAQAEVAAARLDTISAASRVRTAAGRLNTSIGRPAGTGVSPAIEDAPSAEAGNVEALTAAALEQRPELAALRRHVLAAEATWRAARASRSPHVRADGSLGLRDVDFVPETEEWQAGVSVEVPLFDGGARRSRIARAAAERTRAEAGVAAMELRVREEVWTAVAEIERARVALVASAALVRDREEALRVVRARYEAGSALATDLLTTQTALASAEAGLAGVRWELRQAEAVLARATGSGPGRPIAGR